jgi:hypothetical protein
VKTVQEAKGHGLKAWPYASDFNGAADQDGIIIYKTCALRATARRIVPTAWSHSWIWMRCIRSWVPAIEL